MSAEQVTSAGRAEPLPRRLLGRLRARRGRPLIRRRWLRWTARAILLLIALMTLFSFSYNLATDGAERPARTLYPGPYLHVDGRSIAYRSFGSRGTPIVLLGGFVEASWVWVPVGRLLARNHRVFALDLPPFGYSQRKGPYTLVAWARLVGDFVARLGLRRPLVVGHSLGAAVAVELGLERPRAIGGVVLLDGDALPIGGPRWFARFLIDPFYTTLFRLLTRSGWVVRQALARAYGPHPPAVSSAQVKAWQRPFLVEGTASAFHAMLGQGIQGVPAARLGRLRVPRLVVWGEHDSVDPLSAGRQAARTLRTRIDVVRSAGHLSMLERPGAVARTLASFAVSVRSSAP
ncbi:MAG: alpha/beta fold hydrolase [Gaiellaceae bacterium]